MYRRSPFWLLALLLLGLMALVPLSRGQSAQRKSPPASQRQAPAQGASKTATPPPIAPDIEVRRLILKDGSYQQIERYRVEGDRVSYLSAERYEWEEIPASLIDWAATEKYARERAAGTLPGARQLDAEEQAERKKEEELSPEVAPGLRLPFQGGVFLLDVYNQQAQLNEIGQNGGELKRNMGRNILRATINPLASARQTIELKGAHAQVQSHVADPFLYVNVEPDENPKNGAIPDARDRFKLLRVESDAKKNNRVVGSLKIAMYGKVSQERKAIPTNVEVFSGPWLKITPAEPLEPGEYALVEMLADNQMNLYVWDFGVNPNAAPNASAWRPAPSKAGPETKVPPVLQQHR
jgi:hypothetical protein